MMKMIMELTLENSRLNKEVADLRTQLALGKPKKISKPVDPNAPPKVKKVNPKALSEEDLVAVRKANGERLAAHNKAKKEAKALADARELVAALEEPGSIMVSDNEEDEELVDEE